MLSLGVHCSGKYHVYLLYRYLSNRMYRIHNAIINNMSSVPFVAAPIEEKSLWTRLKPLWITLMVLAVGLVLAGAIFGILHYANDKLHHPNTSPQGGCQEGQTLCNGTCCNNSSTSNGVCTCADSCSTGILANGLCCPPGYTMANQSATQCCTDSSATDCVSPVT